MSAGLAVRQCPGSDQAVEFIIGSLGVGGRVGLFGLKHGFLLSPTYDPDLGAIAFFLIGASPGPSHRSAPYHHGSSVQVSPAAAASNASVGLGMVDRLENVALLRRTHILETMRVDFSRYGLLSATGRLPAAASARRPVNPSDPAPPAAPAPRPASRPSSRSRSARRFAPPLPHRTPTPGSPQLHARRRGGGR